MMFDLTGKTAYVAGGEGRIGSATVKAFRKQGAETYSIDVRQGADILTNIQCFTMLDPALDVFVNATYPGSGTCHLEIFHETTNGPFDNKNTIFPEWSPNENDVAACKLYKSQLNDNLKEYLK